MTKRRRARTDYLERVRITVPAGELSWWMEPHTREEFKARAKAEQARMAESRGKAWVDRKSR